MSADNRKPTTKCVSCLIKVNLVVAQKISTKFYTSHIPCSNQMYKIFKKISNTYGCIYSNHCPCQWLLYN